MAKKLKNFTVWADVKINCGTDIKAESLEDAIAQARTLKEEDFVEVFENFNDGSVTVTGITENT